MNSQLRLFPAIVLATSVLLLGGAFAFQYIGGLHPCVLCIWQRWPHGAAIVLALLALVFADRRAALWLVALAGVALLVSAGIGAFHVGVEQQWWEGTAECGGTATFGEGIDKLRESILSRAESPRCDQAPWSLFGISMAGYNFLISGIVGLGALWYAWRCASRPA